MKKVEQQRLPELTCHVTTATLGFTHGLVRL